MNSLIDNLFIFFQAGGIIIPIMFLLTIILWFLIMDLYLYHYFEFSKDLIISVNQYKHNNDSSSWAKKKWLTGLKSELTGKLKKKTHFISCILKILPLLGLLGTVLGIISVFENLGQQTIGNIEKSIF